LDDCRLIDAELDADVGLDATERRPPPVEKAADVVENAVAGGRLGGEEGWQATTLKRGEERRWRPVGGAVESTAAV
jgi:hypothetical protein